MALFISSEEDI